MPQAVHFAVDEAPVGDLRDGEFLVANRFLSVEPAMRGCVNDIAPIISPPVPVGDAMRASPQARSWLCAIPTGAKASW